MRSLGSSIVLLLTWGGLVSGHVHVTAAIAERAVFGSRRGGPWSLLFIGLLVL